MPVNTPTGYEALRQRREILKAALSEHARNVEDLHERMALILGSPLGAEDQAALSALLHRAIMELSLFRDVADAVREIP